MKGGAAAASNPTLPERDAIGLNPQIVLPLLSSVRGTQMVWRDRFQEDP